MTLEYEGPHSNPRRKSGPTIFARAVLLGVVTIAVLVPLAGIALIVFSDFRDRLTITVINETSQPIENARVEASPFILQLGTIAPGAKVRRSSRYKDYGLAEFIALTRAVAILQPR